MFKLKIEFAKIFRYSKRFLSTKSLENREQTYENINKKSNTKIHVWGYNETGALGFDKINYLSRPKYVEFFKNFDITTVACGFGFTAFAVCDNKSNSKLYGTGLNTDCQIGYHTGNEEIIYSPEIIPLPLQNSDNSRIIKLAAGGAHLAVLTDEGLFMLGNNCYGQCGSGSVSNYAQPTCIPAASDKKIVDVECGQDHTLAIADDGSVYSCGWSADGQTGLGHFTSADKFTRVRGDINSEKIMKIASRSDCVLALNDRGEVFGWGNTEYGQISLYNNDTQLNSPIYIEKLKPCGRIKDIASAGAFCLALNENGEVFVWGYGLLGVTPPIQQSINPLKIPETLFGGNRVEKIKCGVSYMMAVTSNGELFAWGKNLRHCLGLDSEKDQHFPQKVAISGYVEEVSCGIDHTVAICRNDCD